MTTQELKLKILRTAYRLATTDEERAETIRRAEEVKNPTPKTEQVELLNNVKQTVLAPPEWTHPYWGR